MYKTYAVPDDSDHDGLPDAWEQSHGLNPHSPAGDFKDANADPDGDGFTCLEDYLKRARSASPGPGLNLRQSMPQRLMETSKRFDFSQHPRSLHDIKREGYDDGIVPKRFEPGEGD